MNKSNELITLVHRADFQRIESARDRVTFSDLGALAAAYSKLETWEQKAALINLVQDHLDPRFRPIMLDFLRAPDNWDDDIISLTKAIAICHLDENLDGFMRYYNDRALLKAHIQKYRSTVPSNPKRTQKTKTAKPARKNSPWQIAAITAVIVGLAFLAIAFINWKTLQEYHQEGISVKARITDKSDEGQTCIGVSYFDKDLFDGGKLYLTEVCDFVTGDIWQSTREGGHEMVVFLPADPENHTLFAASLENDLSIGVIIGGVLLMVGIVGLVVTRLSARKD